MANSEVRARLSSVDLYDIPANTGTGTKISSSCYCYFDEKEYIFARFQGYEKRVIKFW